MGGINSSLLEAHVACYPDGEEIGETVMGHGEVNFDTAVSDKKMSFGMIVRDLDGFVLGGGIIEIDTQVEWAELKAFKESILFAINRKFGDVLFETDNVSMVNRIKKKRDKDITILGHQINEVYKLLKGLNVAKICWAKRCCNRTTDFICKDALTENYNLIFDVDYPADIHDLILNDSIN
ncbi:hypothetical protein Goarm_020324 [Gossypium armourianum]|uniref:RNase H type-1 domain-containing protein n=1 Tax=Gossypium armourianum TaxID=34283 RepID=A0A7J9INA3_9ROSI|nr:hypothetical protein [Gossypium armourianum]